MNGTETQVDWRTMLPPIFAECVTPAYTSPRYDLSIPMVVGGRIYATDGRIAVRMPAPEGWALPNPEKIPGIEVMFEGLRNCGEPIQIPEVVGLESCECCGQLTVTRPTDRLKLAEGYWIGRGFAAMLRRNGAIAYLPDKLSDKEKLRFTIGEIEGILMPMTAPSPGEAE